MQDSAGNAAETRLRLVHVVCPADRLLCSTEEETPQRWYCSLAATFCFEGSTHAAVSTANSQPVGNGSSSGSAKSSATNNATSGTSIQTRLWLQGPSEITVPTGSVYTACGRSVPLSVPCDNGARALHPVEGDLSQVHYREHQT